MRKISYIYVMLINFKEKKPILQFCNNIFLSLALKMQMGIKILEILLKLVKKNLYNQLEKI